MDEATAAPHSGRVLVVDDDRTARSLHCGILSTQFEVVAAASGDEAVAICGERLPDLVVLDIDMPGLDGYETCRRIRRSGDVPVIFATAHESIEEHLMAYDAGGNDLVMKPVTSEILLRKAALAIGECKTRTRLEEETGSLRKMAMDFLSGIGETGKLLNFMRAGMACRSHAALAANLAETARDFGIDCGIMIRHAGGPTLTTTRDGAVTPLERSILEFSAGMDKIFQFKRRLAVNYERISIVVGNMPDEAEAPAAAGRTRDNLVILAEIAEALCDNVDMRLESMRRAEQLQVALAGAVGAVESLQDKYGLMLGDARVLLQGLVDGVERSYSWVGTTQTQETAINGAMDASIQRILSLLAEGGGFHREFGNVLEALRGDRDDKTVELF